MKMLMKRWQSVGLFSRTTFSLTVKVELDDDEKALIEKYKMGMATILVEDNPFKVKSVGFLAVSAGVVVFAIIIGFMQRPEMIGILMALASGYGASYATAYFMNPHVTLNDLLCGASLSTKSLPDLMKKEKEMLEIGLGVRCLLEHMKNWGNYDVVEVPLCDTSLTAKLEE